MNKLTLKAFIYLISLSLPMSVSSEETKTLKAGLFYIVPFGYIHADTKEITGVTAELMRAIELDSGIPISLKLVPYKRLIESLRQGSVDFAIFFRSDVTNEVSDSLLPVYDLDTVVLTRRGFIVRQYEDLYGLRLASPLGVRYTSRFDADKKLRVSRVEDYSNAMLMLDKGFVDGVVGPEKILSYQLNVHQLNKAKFTKAYTLTTNTAWLQFSKKFHDEPLKQRVMSSVKALKAKGKVDEILSYSFE